MNGAYGSWVSPETSWVLVTNVSAAVFYTPGGTGPYNAGVLPALVKMRLQIHTHDDVSGVGAASRGPDRVLGTGDDIRSY